MRNNKVVKVVKINKEESPEQVELKTSFTFNPHRKRIGTFIEDSMPTLEKKYKQKYKTALDSIYTSTNGLYLIETDAYRLTVEIRNDL